MKPFITALIVTLFLASIVRAQTIRAPEGCLEQNEKTAALINQYRELRERKRRLPEGVFDADLDDYKGKLHEVLFELGLRLGHPPYTKERVVACLGEPDAIRSEEQMTGLLGVYYREKRAAGQKVLKRKGREYLIYFWRGWHDLLFYVSEGGTVSDHGWWFAYE